MPVKFSFSRATTKIVARWRERSAAAECIKLAIKSGGDNQNKAVTVVNQPLGPVLFHVQCRIHAPGVARGTRDAKGEGIVEKSELPR